MFHSLCEWCVAMIIEAHPHQGGSRSLGMGFSSLINIPISHGGHGDRETLYFMAPVQAWTMKTSAGRPQSSFPICLATLGSLV